MKISTFHSNAVFLQQNIELRECCCWNKIRRKVLEMPKKNSQIDKQLIRNEFGPQTKQMNFILKLTLV